MGSRPTAPLVDFVFIHDDDALFTEKAVTAEKKNPMRREVKLRPYFLEHSNRKCRPKNNWNEKKKSHL